MKRHPLKPHAIILFLAIMLPITASASGNRKGPPQGPPPEAVTACHDKSPGDRVEFTGPRGETFKGTCREIDDVLAAVPDNIPEAGRPKRH